MENQRVRMSKAMLKEALIQLLQEKQIEKITIYELCDRAQINRTTFYKYYGTQYDLLNDIEKDIFFELEQRLMVGGAEINDLHLILDYLVQERRKCLVFINSTNDKDFAEKLFGLPVIHNLISNKMPNQPTTAQAEYLYRFLCQGSYAIITKWLNDEHRCSSIEISHLIHSLSVRVFQKL